MVCSLQAHLSGMLMNCTASQVSIILITALLKAKKLLHYGRTRSHPGHLLQTVIKTEKTLSDDAKKELTPIYLSPARKESSQLDIPQKERYES
ncbi:hypothetical protein BOTBODRAFT_39752 [Botryobasidium botryosum FD-172 SS1]|uniref:Uncharacterized protein n=1 Tax=Botryobasidium botryosum (strain FD-172 SS1) TaxID=930990 RepID=A0A067LVA4_BOTB1|nr:hypothetical protein BOTBODRAFT_39752 [Botryobasidium botryosum FD-172 SS1]